MDFTHGGNVYKVARERNIKVEDIIDFSANINPKGLSQKGNERLKNAWSGLGNYPDPDYVALKEGLAKFHECQPEDVFLGNGAIDIIFFLIRSLNVKKGMILAPTFVEYERALLATNAEVTPFYLREEDDFKLDIDKLLNSVEGHDCLIICNPNNPTGHLVSIDELKKVMAFCQEKEIRLIIDEAFMDFSDLGELEKHSCIPFIETYKNMYVLRSITKFFAVPGLRLGYLMTKNDDFAVFYKNCKEPWCVNFFAQEYTIGALEDKNYIKDSKEYIVSERCWFYEKLKAFKAIQPYRTYGNYIFFKYLGKESLKDFLEQEGILVRSCSNYRGLDEQFFRIAVKKHHENKRLLEALMELCNEKIY